MISVSTVILCGGHSTRMGHDKAQLIYNKRSFLQRLVDQLSGADEILLSTGEHKSYPDIDVIHIVDLYKERGPLGGIHKALSVMHSEWLFAVACDMPFMNFEFVTKLLLYNNKQVDAIIPVDGNGIKHVLGGLYNKRILSIIERMLDDKKNKVNMLLERINVRYVSISSWKEEKKLTNVNDFNMYQKILKKPIPIISVVGYSDSGKTTIIENVIRYLCGYEVRAAYIKHTDHPIDLNQNQKDSEKALFAGAVVSTVISNEQTICVENRSVDIHDFIQKLTDIDLIITEGFKKEQFPKVLVTKVNNDNYWPVREAECQCIISDANIISDRKVFKCNDIAGFSTWLIKRIREEWYNPCL